MGGKKEWKKGEREGKREEAIVNRKWKIGIKGRTEASVRSRGLTKNKQNEAKFNTSAHIVLAGSK